MGHALVIVESPAKARKIGEYLGDGYQVESSIGHIRDLPRNADDVPKAYKGEKWARLGIDVENDFKPLYVVSKDKKDQIKKLKALMKDADELYLATDKDREGEAIAWHLLEVLSPPNSVEVKRMVFTEITPKAIEAALNDPRELDRKMVDAQEARRMLDRLYGYEVSPVLWKKVLPGLSAGRVQSVATRIVVERERERIAFISANYWDLEAQFSLTRDPAAGEPSNFTAKLLEVDGQRIASGRDFAQNGELTNDVVVIDEARATTLAAELDGQPSEVRSVDAKPYRRRPAAPFITSTLQQEAGRKLGLSSSMAMRAAQGLYEKGLITYMRTDSTTLSQDALDAARSVITEKYGKQYVPDESRIYATKSKGAQEAHEAIRPAGATFRTPESVADECVKSEADVYELIWKRTIASQMTDATGETVNVRVGVESTTGTDTLFSASGTVITHQGFRMAYIDGDDDDLADQGGALPQVTEGDALKTGTIEASGHDTQPPARYTEASLVKKLEELGVGRPSTYASIMGTIQDREYVWKKGSALVPSFKAFSVVNLLEQHFPNLVDYDFTAQMEVDLDSIAEGAAEAIPWLRDFYFGHDDEPGLKEKVDERLGEIDARAINSIPIGVDENGQMVVGRVGRYGPYVQRGDDERASIPDDIAPDELTIEKAIEFIEAPDGIELGDDPETGLPVFVKAGRFGPYIVVGTPDDYPDDVKPKTASLFKSMKPETVTYEEALQLLTLPREIGVHPDDGGMMTVYNGRYGPYVSKPHPEEGKKAETRNIATEEQLLTITVDECVALFKEPKRRGRAEPKPPLKELGLDEVSGQKMVVKDGRFGPYVTDGEFNASLRKGDTVEEITDERASELLALRRERGPAKKAKKKATKKKSTAKKKAPAKKKAAAKKKAPAKKQS
ncbi:MAG: type I DNA topoisomerase [Actinomycetota bacterium]